MSSFRVFDHYSSWSSKFAIFALLGMVILVDPVCAASGAGAIIGKGPGVGVYTLNRIEVTRTYPAGNFSLSTSAANVISPGLTTYAPVANGQYRFQLGWGYNFPDPHSGPYTNSFMVTYEVDTSPADPSQTLVPCDGCNTLSPGFSVAALTGSATGIWTASGFGINRDHTFSMAGFAGSNSETSCCGPNSVGTGNVPIYVSNDFSVPPAINNQTAPPPANGEIRIPVTGAMDFGTDQGVATIDIELVYDPGPAACDISAYSLQLPSQFPGGSGGSFNVGVTAPTGCAWSAIVQPLGADAVPGWLTVVSGASGAGNGMVTLSEGPNLPTNYQGAVVNIAGYMLAVSQPPGPGTATGSYSLNRIEVTRTYGDGFVAVGNNTIGAATQTFLASSLVLAYEAGWDYFWTATGLPPDPYRNRFVTIFKINQLFATVTPGGPSGAYIDMRGNWQASGYGNPRFHTISGSGAATFGPPNVTSGTCNPVQSPTNVPSGNGVLLCSLNAGNVPQPDSNGEIRLVFFATTDFADAGTVTVEIDVVYTAGGGTGPGSAPTPSAMSPAAGSGLTQSFVLTFTDPAGYQNLHQLDALIGSALDGRHNCYIGIFPSSASSGTLYLVDDAGDTGGPYAALAIPSSGSVQNSQCQIAGSGSSISGSGNTLTVTLAITFTSGFAGNKVFYEAALDSSGNNSGWQAMGTWYVPGTTNPAPGPAVTGVSPAHSSSLAGTYTFTFTDSKGWQDIQVADVLVNLAINGIGACYVAIVPHSPSGGSLFLVDDQGDAGGPYEGMVVPSSNTVSNSQCTVSGAGSSFNAFGNTLIVTMAITFNQSFAGNKLFYLAAGSATQNSYWQAVGSVAIP